MKISVVIPTLNEELCLPDLLTRIRGTADGADVEVVVADGGSTDRTLEIARADADAVVECAAGRAIQMHQGALAASGDILLFLHADTRLPESWHQSIFEAWIGPEKPVATAFRLGFDSAKPFYRLVAAAANWRCVLTGVPQGDQGIATSRENYFRVGGFPPVPLMEEYLLIKKLKASGRVRILEGSVITSPRRYEENGRVFNALRNAVLVVLFYLGFSPRVLARLYK